jgi:hypothetical protein
MSVDEVKEKFRSLVEPVVPAGIADKIIRIVDAIEEREDVEELVQLLTARRDT